MDTAKNLRIKKHFSVIAHDENTVELRHGVWNHYSHTLVDENKKGCLFKMILQLDGKCSASEISKNLGVSRSELESLLDHLQRLGVLETNASSAFQRYFDTVMPVLANPASLSELKIKFPVLLIGDRLLVRQIYDFLIPHIDQTQIKILDPELFEELADNNEDWLHDGLLLAKKIEKFQELKKYFIIYAQQNLQPVTASRLNRIAHQLNIPWLHAAIDGPFIFIGPTIVPNRGACYDCFETRIRMNLKETQQYQNYKNALSLGKVYHYENPMDPALRGLAASHTAMEALNFLLTESSFTRNKVLSIYLPTMEMLFNEILRVSGCPTCGSVIHRDDNQLYFDMKSILEDDAA